MAILFLPAVSFASDENTSSERWLPLNDADIKIYRAKFRNEYKRQNMHRQICEAFAMNDIIDDEKAEIPVTMHGPEFRRLAGTDQVRGMLSIGFVALYEIEFKGGVPQKTVFTESFDGEGRHFDTLGECSAYVNKQIEMILKSSNTKSGTIAPEKKAEHVSGGNGG